MSQSYIEIKDLALMCHLRIFADYTTGEESDDLADTIDYKEVLVGLQKMTSSTRFCLIEALARGIKEKILATSCAFAVEVRVRKPNVLVEAGAVSYNLIAKDLGVGDRRG